MPYTGMKVGRGHHWTYEGEWIERKLGKDTWEVDFRARKTRKGKAPEGSGAPVGTEYLWFFAPTLQRAMKLDANAYETRMTGLKWKVGFRPATAKTWDFEWAKTGETARRRMIRILRQTLADLVAEEKAGEPQPELPGIEMARPAPARKPRSRKAKPAAHARSKAEA
ncbi:MAG: hypothetical protein QOE90_2527 [Thermoplasmata archaeon]|jgi:plasmid stabilization system protein ParE|nr:hypothetical protein [Thermoplasmata archaeon]